MSIDTSDDLLANKKSTLSIDQIIHYGLDGKSETQSIRKPTKSRSPIVEEDQKDPIGDIQPGYHV